MKPPTICGNAVSENLHALAADLVNPRGRAMDRWDEIRRQVETHKGSDLPRLNYEGVLEDFSEQFAEGAKEIERLTAENERLRAAVWAAIPWMDDLEHMGSIVDQTRRAQTLNTLRTAVQQQAVNSEEGK